MFWQNLSTKLKLVAANGMISAQITRNIETSVLIVGPGPVGLWQSVALMQWPK
jgi:hypothetical protein